MPWILMKNNMKLMLRSKWILLLVILLPVFVVAMLSSVFDEMLGSYEMADTFRVGYSVAEGSIYSDAMEEFSKSTADSELQMTRIETKNIEQTMQDDDLAAFLVVNEKDYTLYTSADYSKEARVIREIVNQFFFQLEHYDIVMQSEQPTAEVTEVEVTPMASSVDYYGIIEIVYFSMCGIVVLAVVIASERKNQITRRMKIARVSCFQQLLGKLIPCTATVFLATFLGAILSIIFVGNKWGNLFKSAGILLLVSLLAACLGLFALELFKNVAVSIVTTFGLVWFMGFYGGSFQNYMQLNMSESMKKISPLYFANRTLVEYRTMGSSDYSLPCIIIFLGLSAILCIATIQIMKVRKEG